MGKLLRSLSTVPALSFLFTPIAYAQKVETCPVGDFSPLCTLNATNFGATIGRIITLIFVVAIIAALFYLIWGGIKWLMSEGDKTSVEAARQHIISAIIGLIVIFMSYFILNLVIGFFVPGATLQNLWLPTINQR